MNSDIYEVIKNVCWAQLELDPEYQLALKEHNRAIDHISDKVSLADMRILESGIFDGMHIGGRAMFMLGFRLGQNPAEVFQLPELDHYGNLVDKGQAVGKGDAK